MPLQLWCAAIAHVWTGGRAHAPATQHAAVPVRSSSSISCGAHPFTTGGDVNYGLTVVCHSNQMRGMEAGLLACTA
jgi:hypothetical protein